MQAEPLNVEMIVTRSGTTLDVVRPQTGSQRTGLLRHGRSSERLVLRRLASERIRGRVEFPGTDHAGVVLAGYREDLALGVPLAKEIEGHPMVPVLTA